MHSTLTSSSASSASETSSRIAASSSTTMTRASATSALYASWTAVGACRTAHVAAAAVEWSVACIGGDVPFMPFALPMWLFGVAALALLGGGAYVGYLWLTGAVVG